MARAANARVQYQSRDVRRHPLVHCARHTRPPSASAVAARAACKQRTCERWVYKRAAAERPLNMLFTRRHECARPCLGRSRAGSAPRERWEPQPQSPCELRARLRRAQHRLDSPDRAREVVVGSACTCCVADSMCAAWSGQACGSRSRARRALRSTWLCASAAAAARARCTSSSASHDLREASLKSAGSNVTRPKPAGDLAKKSAPVVSREPRLGDADAWSVQAALYVLDHLPEHRSLTEDV